MEKFIYNKSLGQNFLKDNNIVDKIVSVSNIDKDTLVIEIGPGSGMLSKKIIPLSKFSILYEIDKRLKNILEDEFICFDNYKLVFNDILKVNLLEDIKNYQYDKLYVIANLPYYITTPIINKIINEIYPDKIVVMVQKEVAYRLSSLCGSKDYGMISALFQSRYDISIDFFVSRSCFVPEPNVDSAVISMNKRDDFIDVDINVLDKLLKDSFKYKRKKLKNNLINYNLDTIDKILKKYNLSLDNRAEDIGPDIFVEIAKIL